MIKEAIDRLLELAHTDTFEIGGRPYTNKPVHACPDPIPGVLVVRTLTGLVDLIEAGLEEFTPEECVIHVESFKAVALVKSDSDVWGRRQEYIRAAMEDVAGFPFGRFISSEEFAIWLQAGFVPHKGDVEEVTRIASSITTEAILNSEDDGVSQRVTLKKGVTLKEQITAKRRVKLAPYRTFREVEQPVSEFVFRVRQEPEGEPPACGLFEADGGKWKLDAMLVIKAWLESKNLHIQIAA